MNNFNFDKYLDVVNEEKKKYGLENYSPLYPMFRMENGNLFVAIMLVSDDDDVWDKKVNVKPKYWALLDIMEEKIVCFNKTEEKDFVLGNIIEKTYDDSEKEISKYKLLKTIEYKNYLKKDIKNFEMPIQEKLGKLLGKEINLDGEKINIDDYVFANIEEKLDDRINKFVEMILWVKYDSIIYYYDLLFKNIIEEFKEKKVDLKKLKLCIEVMNNYYPGVKYIDNLFNL